MPSLLSWHVTCWLCDWQVYVILLSDMLLLTVRHHGDDSLMLIEEPLLLHDITTINFFCLHRKFDLGIDLRIWTFEFQYLCSNNVNGSSYQKNVDVCFQPLNSALQQTDQAAGVPGNSHCVLQVWIWNVLGRILWSNVLRHASHTKRCSCFMSMITLSRPIILLF